MLCLDLFASSANGGTNTRTELDLTSSGERFNRNISPDEVGWKNGSIFSFTATYPSPAILYCEPQEL
ncbi:hypothetical protein OLMES_2111 [Oleiphilus messinensis]|uniref:Uncharacterized protein n=1 Tax=Oleiphilus messinensis TaxID=141451 RepID=A0A1Y0I9T0_9GAMM|nr:hypothetical protein OLMES_2111 [Oleiphilus messinensis]